MTTRGRPRSKSVKESAEIENTQLAPPLADSASKSAAPALPKPPAFYAVRSIAPFGIVQSASLTFGTQPTIMRADDPRLPELQACQWLEITEA